MKYVKRISFVKNLNIYSYIFSNLAIQILNPSTKKYKYQSKSESTFIYIYSSEFLKDLSSSGILYLVGHLQNAFKLEWDIISPQSYSIYP